MSAPCFDDVRLPRWAPAVGTDESAGLTARVASGPPARPDGSDETAIRSLPARGLMPAVFVHGVPDTAHMWDRLLDAVDRTDTVRLSLPGFGTEIPTGWSATKEGYAAWLERELAAVGEPVDLVAHDWGAILAQRVASVRPDLIRTLACGSGPLDTEYQWHPIARAWQTPDLGEQIMTTMLEAPRAELVAVMVAAGAPPDLAALQSDRFDRRMAECILGLYRSAVTVGAEWQPAVDAMPRRPAMVFHGIDDSFVGAEVAVRLAARLGAELTAYPDCGHWWAWSRVPQIAAALTRLWT